MSNGYFPDSRVGKGNLDLSRIRRTRKHPVSRREVRYVGLPRSADDHEIENCGGAKVRSITTSKFDVQIQELSGPL